MRQGKDARALTSLATIGVTSALSSGAVMNPNQSRSLGGGGTHAQTVPCRECMSTWIRKCILHTKGIQPLRRYSSFATLCCFRLGCIECCIVPV